VRRAGRDADERVRRQAGHSFLALDAPVCCDEATADAVPRRPERVAMPEDLQALIDHLQRDAVEEGKRRAGAIVEQARVEADARLRAAEEEAARIRADAERDADRFVQRGTVALEQAGRDLLITVRQALDQLFSGLIRTSLDEALTPDLLADVLTRMVDAYGQHGGRERRMAALLGEKDLDALARLYAGRLRERLPGGVELRLDGTVRRGFRLEMVDEHVTHDFTAEAIAEVLADHLRPRLADLLPRAVVRLERDAPDGRSGAD
jgi:V/A-type H+-transporting ATPase subunit E